MVEQIKSLHPREGVVISIKPATSLVVHAPAAVVSIVLSNILRNAWKCTQTGSIKISIAEHCVSVRDTGTGMTPQQQERVFEPFYRIDESARLPSDTELPVSYVPSPAESGALIEGQIEGLGLGLAIVRHLCDVYAWSLEVSSAPGEGSCFTVFFSRDNDDVHTAKRQ